MGMPVPPWDMVPCRVLWVALLVLWVALLALSLHALHGPWPRRALHREGKPATAEEASRDRRAAAPAMAAYIAASEDST